MDPRVGLRIAYFLIACLAVGMVMGACRATTLRGCVRETMKHFLSMAAGIVGLCVAIWLLSLVSQA